jgi:hypothetical protein
MLIMGAAPAAAQPAAQGVIVLSQTDAAGLAAQCTSIDPARRNFCDGYISATLDQLSARRAICISQTLNYDALRAAVVRQLQLPQQARIHASVALQTVLTSSIPCPQARPPR